MKRFNFSPINLVTGRSALTRLSCTAIAVCLLASCGSTAPKIQKAAQVTQKPVAEEKVYNSDDYLRLARENNDSATYLFNAADAAHKEQRFEKSMIVIKSMQQAFVPLEIKQKLLVLEASNFIALGHLNEAEKSLTSDLAQTTEIRHDINRLKAKLYGKQNRYIESLRSLFELEKAAENGEVADNKEDIARTIWHQLNQLPDVSFDTFQYQDYTNAKSWIDLVRITRLYTGQPSVLQRQLKNWYDLHPWHTAMDVLPESFQLSLEAEPFTPAKIAVVLPFTGKLRKQAQAIRNGLLVANQDKHNIELMFIDSNLPITTIEQRLQAQQVEFMIGPLVKDKIEKFAANPIIAATPTLFLNRIALPDNPNQQHFFFGLTPEDEAAQAAEAMFKMGYKKPSIIAPRNSLGRRLSDMFTKTWLSQRSSEKILMPEVRYYANQTEMQVAVKNLMDVEQSKERIKKIRTLINKQLETETRNRKDMDVIYLIGNNTQTKLLKPFIDVNTSVHTKSIPVYATSRSHALLKPNDDKRDLRSLTFTEIPWMLESEKRFTKQRALFDRLWPTLDESMRRLFALGYDALYLVDRIAQLRVLNGLTEQGMNGLISIDPNGFVNRRHNWAKYNAVGQVEPATLD